MISSEEFEVLKLNDQISLLYEKGTFIMSIRYYRHKVNLYLLGNYYLEVFVNHKQGLIEKITRLDPTHSRMQFYSDQIQLIL